MNMNLENLMSENCLMLEQEILFLSGLISSLNPKTIVELGGGGIGTSSMVFLNAIQKRKDSKVYSIDICEMIKRGDNHILIQKNCADVECEELDNSHIDILFFDAHVIWPQFDFYHKMVESKLITEKTILILHDTNYFYEPYTSKFMSSNPNFPGIETEKGYVHQAVERTLVNYFKLQGYDIFSLKTKPENHNENYEFLYGLSVCQKFQLFEPAFLHWW